jgi:hypothetical protein
MTSLRFLILSLARPKLRRKVALFSALLFLVALPFQAVAHGTLFFEFAPDEANPVTIFELETPSQPFYPPNDFLRGFDIWVSNTGTAGTATFGLRDEADNLLSSKTITIPHINPAYGGTRLHIDFDSNVAVDYSKLYRIRVISSMPELALYNASQFQILQHNTTGLPYYEVQEALLGSVKQNYAFKFALYETQESSIPVISAIHPVVLGPTQARIDFNANEPVDARVDFSHDGTVQSTSWTNTFSFCTPGHIPCSVLLNTIGGKTYTFTLFIKDEWGNEASVPDSFSTPVDPDVPITPPPPPPTTPPPPVTPPPPGNEPPPPPPPGNPPTNPPPPTIPPEIPPPPPITPPVSPPPPNGSGSGSSTTPPPDGGSGPVSVTIIDPTTTTLSDGATETTYSLLITWNPSPEIEATDGYAVEIYNDQNELERRVIVSSETRELRVDKLAPGVYRINIYSNRNGSLIKIGDYTITIKPIEAKSPFTATRIILAALLTLGGVGGVILGIEAHRRKKKAFSERARGAFDTYQH